MAAIEKALGSLAFTHDVSEARKELGDMKTEIASLREQLAASVNAMEEAKAFLRGTHQPNKERVGDVLDMLNSAIRGTSRPSDVSYSDNQDLRKKNASLREQLRLAHDKMAEQVRQARYDTAFEIRTAMFPLDTALKIEEANAPKD